MAGNPAVNTVASLIQAQATEFDKLFVKNLKGNTPAINCTQKRYQSQHAGINRQIYMYQTLGANLTQATDGVVGSPIALNVETTSCTLGEWNDFTNFSAFSLAASLDEPVESANKELAYRAAQTLNTLAITVANEAVTIDTSVTKTVSSGAVLAVGDVRALKQELVGRSVQDMPGGKFRGLIHPFVLGDLWNGSAVNASVVDFWKYTGEGQRKYDELAGGNQDIPVELPGTGVVFWQTPFVTQVPDLSSSSTGLCTYVFGDEGEISVFLKVPGDTNIEEGDWRTIETNMVRDAAPSAYDAVATIGGWVSYRFHVGFMLPPDTTQRIRISQNLSAIS